MTYSMVWRRARRPGSSVRIAALVALSALAACSGGLSTQEAAAECEIERKNKQTVTAEAYQACIGCYELCGSDCKAQGTNPETYVCPD
jgi:hypothetical protein